MSVDDDFLETEEARQQEVNRREHARQERLPLVRRVRDALREFQSLLHQNYRLRRRPDATDEERAQMRTRLAGAFIALAQRLEEEGWIGHLDAHLSAMHPVQRTAANLYQLGKDQDREGLLERLNRLQKIPPDAQAEVWKSVVNTVEELLLPLQYALGERPIRAGEMSSQAGQLPAEAGPDVGAGQGEEDREKTRPGDLLIPPWVRGRQEREQQRAEQVEQARRHLGDFAETWAPVCNHLENQLMTPIGIEQYTGVPSGEAGHERIERFLSLWTENFLTLGRRIAEEGLAECYEGSEVGNDGSIEAAARCFIAGVLRYSIGQEREAIDKNLRAAYETGGDFYEAVRSGLTSARGHAVWVLREKLARSIGVHPDNLLDKNFAAPAAEGEADADGENTSGMSEKPTEVGETEGVRVNDDQATESRERESGNSSFIDQAGTEAVCRPSPQLPEARPIPESIETIADPALRQRATDAWRAASLLRRLMEQWGMWFHQLQTTGDADSGLAVLLAGNVSTCVRALCSLGVNIPTFRQAMPDDLLNRFPSPPYGELEPPELKDPRWRQETESFLQRDDVLMDEGLRRQIREVMQRPDWIDDHACRQRVGELLLRGDWQSEERHLLQYYGETLCAVSWQQDTEYRRRMQELLWLPGWRHLQAELLGFTQLLETAPSTAFVTQIAPKDQANSANLLPSVPPHASVSLARAVEGNIPTKRASKGKRRGGKPPLEVSNPLKVQVYSRIKSEHQAGGEHLDTVNRLKTDKDFIEQVKEAGEKLNTDLVRNALSFFDQRERSRAAKNQETETD